MLTRAEPVQFTQEVASKTWTIDHNLGRVCAVSVTVDIDGKIHTILPNSIRHTENQTIIGFTKPYAGGARLF